MILGLDISSTSTGCVRLNDDGSLYDWRRIAFDASATIEVRMIDAGKMVADLAKGCADVWRERQFLSLNQGGEKIYFLTGHILAEVWRAENLQVGEVATSTLKKFATGSGKAKKPEMIAAARAKWDVPAQDDIADACWVAEYGRQQAITTALILNV